jgi:hypothetical protein
MLGSDEGSTQSLSDATTSLGSRTIPAVASVAKDTGGGSPDVIRGDGVGRFRLERIKRGRRPVKRVDREVVIFRRIR